LLLASTSPQLTEVTKLPGPELGHQDGEEARQEAVQWERIAAFGRAVGARLRQTAVRTSPHINESLALPGPEEAELCWLCYAAAWFDELAHRPAEEHKILNFIGAPAPIPPR
jgi:hypothetical protein